MAAISDLPQHARAKFTRLHDFENDAHALMSSPQKRMTELRAMLTNAPNGEHAASANREITRLEHQFMLYRERWTMAVGLNTQITHWLSSVPAGAILIDAHDPCISEAERATLLPTVESLRKSISDLRDEIKKTRRAPLPPNEKKQLMRAHIAALGGSCTPEISFAGDQCTLSFQQGPEISRAHNLTLALAWLDPERLMARLDVVIDRQPAPDFALTVTARNKRMAELTEMLGEHERKEEKLIELAADLGHPIDRRRDADPAAVLNLKIKQRPIKAAA